MSGQAYALTFLLISLLPFRGQEWPTVMVVCDVPTIVRDRSQLPNDRLKPIDRLGAQSLTTGLKPFWESYVVTG